MSKILLACTDSVLTTAIRTLLLEVNFACEVVSEGSDCIQRLSLNECDLAVIDWQLDGINSLDLLRQFRMQEGELPIIVLSPPDSVLLRVRAIDAGADDAIMKPFLGCELVARAQALMRRSTKQYERVLRGRHLMMDAAASRVMVDEKPVHLLPKEMTLLEYFLRYQGQVFSAEHLIARVWSSNSDVTVESIRTYIKRLRQKLDRIDENSIIRTVHGVGYVFDKVAHKTVGGKQPRSTELDSDIIVLRPPPIQTPIF